MRKVTFELPEVRDSVTVYVANAAASAGILGPQRARVCRFCGSSLFYRRNDEDGVGIAAGCLDRPTGLHIGQHIFLKDKGD